MAVNAICYPTTVVTLILRRKLHKYLLATLICSLSEFPPVKCYY